MTRYSENDFRLLKDNGLAASYKAAAIAMKYYYSDPETFCEKQRKVLASLLKDCFTILREDAPEKIIDMIRRLERDIPEKFHDEKLFDELHNSRLLGNSYVHPDGRLNDPVQDRYTCFLALRYISGWVVRFKKDYPTYRAEQNRKNTEKKKRRKKWWMALLTIGGVFSVAAAILGGTGRSRND